MFLLKIIKPALRPASEKLVFRRCLVSQSENKFSVVSVYHLSQVKEVDRALNGVRKWLQEKGATGRFHINSQGVNCQLCFSSEEQVNGLR